jgi:hypothetical protein
VEEFHGQLKIGGGKKKSAPRLGKTEKEEDAEENFLFRSNVQ